MKKLLTLLMLALCITVSAQYQVTGTKGEKDYGIRGDYIYGDTTDSHSNLKVLPAFVPSRNKAGKLVSIFSLTINGEQLDLGEHDYIDVNLNISGDGFKTVEGNINSAGLFLDSRATDTLIEYLTNSDDSVEFSFSIYKASGQKVSMSFTLPRQNIVGTIRKLKS